MFDAKRIETVTRNGAFESASYKCEVWPWIEVEIDMSDGVEIVTITGDGYVVGFEIKDAVEIAAAINHLVAMAGRGEK